MPDRLMTHFTSQNKHNWFQTVLGSFLNLVLTCLVRITSTDMIDFKRKLKRGQKTKPKQVKTKQAVRTSTLVTQSVNVNILYKLIGVPKHLITRNMDHKQHN